MSAREAVCPNCGAPIRFENSLSILVVCEHCHAGSYRRDVNLESIGLVAQVAPIESDVALGVRGTWEGRPFRVLGQVQLDHGAGPWNEWSIVFEDGSSAWLAEAQGQVLVTRRVDAVVDVAWDALAAGAEIALGEHGTWLVAERGRGRVTAVRGELPELVTPGETRVYADVSGRDGGFGTLDYGVGGTCEAVYLGRRVDLSELGLDTSGARRAAPRTVAASKIACPKCAGKIDVRDPESSVRVVCPYCSALLDPTSQDVRVVRIAPKLGRDLPLPIGAKGRLLDQDFEILAYLERSVTADGVRYPWDEWLLRRADGAYRWLVRSQGHWSFVEPLGLADVTRRGRTASWKGRTYRHFSGGDARVDHVLGEVYWEVDVGETVRVDDFVAPPHMLSFEGTDDEKLVSAAVYVEPERVSSAFGLPRPLPRPGGVGMAQPNPFEGRPAAWWRAAGVMIALVLAAFVVLHVIHRGTELHRSTHALAATPASTPPASASWEAGSSGPRIVTDPFVLPASRNRIEIRVTAPGIEAGRFGVEGLLVNEISGETRDFWLRGTPLAGDTSPSTVESETVSVGGLSGGAWRLRLDPRPSSTNMASAAMASADSTSAGGTWQVVVTGPHAVNVFPFVLMLLLCVPPVVVGVLKIGFEGSRWSQSDHAG